ncbi:MAG: hypothetical protein K6L76_14410 [Agarilytica sp.]
MGYQQPLFVKSARISAHLYFATSVAKEISLTSKNARAITIRAGQRASGFIAITDFIEELSKVTINRSITINRIAVKVSRISTEKERAAMALNDFNKVRQKSSDARFLTSLDKAKQETEKSIQSFDEEFDRLILELEQELVESYKQTRTANMLVSTSKIEAAQAGEFQRPLEVIAENLEDAASAIREQLHLAESILHEAKQETRNK